MNLRPYQSNCVEFLAAERLALCVCPAGGGKTIIGAAALAKAANPWDLIGWACNTREQVEQGQKALAAAGVTPRWVKCVAGLKPEDIAYLDFLVIDEVHHLPANSWSLLFDSAKGVVWGLTATPKSGDPDRDWHFGKIWGDRVVKVSRDEVMAGGHLAKGRVVILDLDQPGEHNAEIEAEASAEAIKMRRKCPMLAKEEILRRCTWQATLTRLIENPIRHAAVVSTANREMANDQSVLILVSQIEQGERFAQVIPGAVLAHSKMGAKKRKAAIEAFRSGELRCLIATSLADEGLDVPRASVLILATAGRSAAKLEQRTGRVMRPSEGKTTGLVYDFADTGASMAAAQSNARRRAYKKLGYAIETFNPFAE